MSFRRTHGHNHTSLASAVAMALLGSSALAEAQQLVLEEVIVTAQKRSESLQDVPISVSAFTGKSLQEYGIVDSQSLQLVTPGLVYNNVGAGGSPYLRGVGTRLPAGGLDSSIATYVDDRYVGGSAAAMFDLVDVERVEVLKGPQGTLYGRNATGGAIRVITKDPGEELAGEVGVSVGNYGRTNINGYVGGPVTDSLRAQISATQNKRDGYADNIFDEGNSEWDDRDFQAYRGKMIWDISDRASLKLAAAYWEREDTGAVRSQALDTAAVNVGLARGGITGSRPDEVASAISGDIALDETSADLRFDVAFDAFDFAWITTYAEVTLDSVADGDGTSYRAADVSTASQGDIFTQEIQFVSSSTGALQWLAGAFYLDQEGDGSATSEVAGGALLVSNQNQKTTTEAYALFGQISYDFSDAWSATIGGRWSEEERKARQTVLEGTISGNLLPLPFEDSESWDEFTPSVTLQYQAEAGMAYFTYSRGFKSGGFNYPAASPLSTPLDPEILDNYELGFKGKLLDGMLRLNGAVFYYDYKDQQVTRAAKDDGSNITTVLTTENAANSTILGVEGDFALIVSESLSFSGGFTFLDSEYDEFDTAAKIPVREATGLPLPGYADTFFDAKGESLLRSPDFSGFIAARYELSLENASVPMVLTYSYTGNYKFDFVASQSTSDLKSDAYGLLSARISYLPDSGHWSASVWGNNLTDEDYFNEVSANRQALWGNYAPPRTYGVDFKWMF